MTLRSKVDLEGYLVVLNLHDSESGEEYRFELWPDGAEGLAVQLATTAAHGKAYLREGIKKLEEGS